MSRELKFQSDVQGFITALKVNNVLKEIETKMKNRWRDELEHVTTPEEAFELAQKLRLTSLFFSELDAIHEGRSTI